jgi:hypothetical protein
VLLPVVSPDDGGVAPGAVLGSTGGASSRIAMISDLNESNCAAISASEYDVMDCPNSIRRFHTAARASSCSCPGVSSTDSTSWLAIAAVMQR